jgi:hypothetical protein
MSETTETTFTGNKLLIVIGILSLVAVLIIVGLCFETTRPYITESVKTLLNLIPMFK